MNQLLQTLKFGQIWTQSSEYLKINVLFTAWVKSFGVFSGTYHHRCEPWWRGWRTTQYVQFFELSYSIITSFCNLCVTSDWTAKVATKMSAFSKFGKCIRMNASRIRVCCRESILSPTGRWSPFSSVETTSVTTATTPWVAGWRRVIVRAVKETHRVNISFHFTATLFWKELCQSCSGNPGLSAQRGKKNPRHAAFSSVHVVWLTVCEH